MKKKTRNMLIAGAAGVCIIALLAAGTLALGSGGKDEDAAPAEQAGAAEESEPETAEWLEKSGSNVQQLAAILCGSNWRTPTNDHIVEFNLDGTYKEMDSTSNEKEGTWQLADLTLSESSQDLRNCTAVITLNGSPCTFTSRTETSNASAAENMTVSQYINTSGLAGGKQLVNTPKESSFNLWGIDGDLAKYIPDAAAFTEQFAQFCRSEVPLAQQAGWNKDLKIDYSKGKAQASFTCNDSKGTKVYATFPLDGGVIALSTSSSL